MANAGNLVPARLKNFNPMSNPISHHSGSKAKTLRLSSQLHTCSSNGAISASTKRKDLQSPLIGKNTCRSPRRLITISPGDGRWRGNWTCDYLISLQDLQLQDLVEVDDRRHTDAQVYITLNIHKHASFGLSVDGRIVTSFTRKCSICSSPYCRKIDTKFTVWVLLASRDNRKINQPEIGGDPSVIYVKPGYEADLDSLVQDTLRLTTSVKDICSDLCEKSETTLQYSGGQNKASVDKRWARLLELKKAKL